MAIINTRFRSLGDFPSAEQLDAITSAAAQPAPTRKIVITEDQAGVIVGKAPKKSTAAKKIGKQGSALVDKSAGAPAVDESVLFMGFSVPKRLVPTVLYTPGAQILLFVALVGGGYLAWRHLAGRKATRTIRRRLGIARNPRGSKLERHPDPDVAAAAKFRRDFHWGTPARRVSRRSVSPQPRVLTELGEVASVTYRTKKRGEKAQFFEHEFEGRRPRLGMDIRNKRLHFLGGSYTVTADGITG